MNLRELNYVDFIWDFFFAKVKHRKYITEEVRCLRIGAICPLTGKKQFWKKCTRVRFDDDHRTTFYCELYEFEMFLLTVDMDDVWTSLKTHIKRKKNYYV